MVPVWSFHSHIKSGKLGVKPLTTVHTMLRDTIAKSISPLLRVLPLFHLSLMHMDLRYMKAGKAELIENKTGATTGNTHSCFCAWQENCRKWHRWK